MACSPSALAYDGNSSIAGKVVVKKYPDGSVLLSRLVEGAESKLLRRGILMARFSCLGWLKAISRKSGGVRQAACRGQRPPGRRFVLRVEALEDRLAPAVL